MPWVSYRGWWGNRRYHGSLAGGGGAIEDTMALLQGVVELWKIPLVSFRGWCGYTGCHGSLTGVGGAIEDTMGLLQGVVEL